MRTSPNILESEPARLRPDNDPAREKINALGRIYLEAGLPLAAAFEAALADYRSFETQELSVA
jgi:hypothetical protein